MPDTAHIEVIDAGAVGHYQPEQEWPRALADYLERVEGKSGSAGSRLVYRGILTRFFQSIDVPPADVKAKHIEAFMRSETDRGTKPAPSTQGVRLAAIRGFYELARSRGLVERNPAADAQRPGIQESVPKGLDGPQVKQLLAQIDDTPRGVEHRAIVIGMVLTGLRRSELLSLKRGDLEITGDTARYTTRVKGGRSRKRDVPPPALHAIIAALEARGVALEGMADTEPLFVSSEVMFYRALKRYGEAAGLGNVTPHTLRHAAAKIRRKKGESLEDVQALLGHRNIATTAIYLKQMEGETDTGWHGVASEIGVS